MFAQLRDVLAAENSSIVTEKNQHGRLSGPQGAKANLPRIAIRKGYVCQLGTKWEVHGFPILNSVSQTVKHRAFAPVHRVSGVSHDLYQSTATS
jgi:hypothetical protein